MIQCTGRLLREMGAKPARAAPTQESSGRLGPWHANLIHIDGRKTVLFVNDRTRFNFIVPDVHRAQVRDLGVVFTEGFSRALSDVRVAERTRAMILEECRDTAFAPTGDRRVLGTMNEIAYHYKDSVLEGGGIRYAAIPAIIRNLNRMPFAAVGYRFPVELLRNLYKTAA